MVYEGKQTIHSGKMNDQLKMRRDSAKKNGAKRGNWTFSFNPVVALTKMDKGKIENFP